jgi:hypothetical protein
MTLPSRGRVDAPSGAAGWGDHFSQFGALDEYACRWFAPPRRFAPTLPLEGRVKEDTP